MPRNKRRGQNAKNQKNQGGEPQKDEGIREAQLRKDSVTQIMGDVLERKREERRRRRDWMWILINPKRWSSWSWYDVLDQEPTTSSPDRVSVHRLVHALIFLLIVFGLLYNFVQYLLLAIRASATCVPNTSFYPVTLTITSITAISTFYSEATVTNGSCSPPMSNNTVTTITSFVPVTSTVTITQSSTVTITQPSTVTVTEPSTGSYGFSITTTIITGSQTSNLLASVDPIASTSTYYFWVTSGSTVWQDGVSPTPGQVLSYTTTSLFVTAAALSTPIMSASTLSQLETNAPAYTPTTLSLPTPETTFTVTSTHYITVSVSEVQSGIHSSFTGVASGGWNASTSEIDPAVSTSHGTSTDPVTTTIHITSTSTMTLYRTITPMITSSIGIGSSNSSMSVKSTSASKATEDLSSLSNSSATANAINTALSTKASRVLGWSTANGTFGQDFPTADPPIVMTPASWPMATLTGNFSVAAIQTNTSSSFLSSMTASGSEPSNWTRPGVHHTTLTHSYPSSTVSSADCNQNATSTVTTTSASLQASLPAISSAVSTSMSFTQWRNFSVSSIRAGPLPSTLMVQRLPEVHGV